MRVLYLHQHYSGPAGATATRSHALAGALVARGHRVTLACGRYDGAVTGLLIAWAGATLEKKLRILR